MNTLERYIDQQKMWQHEGRRGVVNLCKIAAALGYKDPMYYRQLERGAVLGDLICFLEDNPGAIEAIVEWIHECIDGGRVPEWNKELELQLEPDFSEETEDEE